MVKRANPDSDGNQSGSASPVSKRARTEDSDDDAAAVSPPDVKREKGKARRNADDSDDEDEEDDGPVDKEEDEKKFEEAHEEFIRAAIEAKRKVHGGIADHGIIEAIEMHQFMCHKYLTFSFGPQINFIIGHNGSGKSAVLSAITVALGGKANSTGRGNGLKSFIREGQSVAEVTISLKNQGEEAYKPQEYGKSIIITRRFTKEGSSSWKIKSKDGKVISTKKDELAAICDHMNIQVDNPMNVLTQDAARQFLSASHPADKYKFFLRGTQLSQLSDEYDTCLENITQTTKVLQKKKEALPDLRAAFREATVRFEEAAKAREQKKKADELKKELAWAHVRAKEEEMTKKTQEAAKMARRLPKIQDSVNEAEARFKAATEEVARYEAEYRDLDDIEHLNERKKQLQDQIRENRVKLTDFKNDEKQMDMSLKATNKQIEEYNQQIAEEARRMEASTQAKREETQRQLDDARAAVSSADQHLQSILEQKRIKSAECDDAKAKGMAAEQERTAAQNRIQECQQMIEKCVQQEKNSLAAYGKDIKGVLEKIGKTRWNGDVPLGPLGVGVKAKDPQRWGEVLRTQLGQFLTAFAVTDARDLPILKKLLQQSGNSGHLVIVYEKDLFDYRSGEPPEHMLTVLRALEIQDPYVLRILINQARIERMFLAPTRLEGDKMLRELRGGGTAWTADGFRVTIFPEGGGSSTPLFSRGSSNSMSLLLTGRDAAGEMQHYQDEIKRVEVDFKTVTQKWNSFKQLFNDGKRAQDALSAQEKQAIEKHRKAKLTVDTLQQAANDDLPAGIAGFEAAKAEAEAEKQSIIEQFADLTRQKAVVDEAQKGLLTSQNEVKKQMVEYEDRRAALQLQIEDTAQLRMVAQSSQKHYEGKLAEEQAKVAQVEATAKVLQEEFTNWTTRAEEYCERVENPRKVDDVQRNLESVQKALKEREKRHGATVEQMTIEVNQAKAKLDAVDKDLKNMTTLNKALKASLIIRLARWQEFRRHIALRCKLVFGFHLSHRGYYGKVLFDHDKGTLQLKVQTDDQTGTQGRDKDPRSLSGGEKSFSTICLLLSLWESIGCPLRCLDEFDVFMDAVNRRISMRMMIDTANQSDKKQYILITPQDMGNVQIGKTVRVHRMTDPERGQGVLAFS